MVNGMHYRHPAVTANAAVTLDHISGGRFNLGLGAGWFEPESKAYGIPLGSLKERFDRFDEGLEVITSLLTNEYTDFNGRYYQLTNARCEPKPVQSRIPIVIGGAGPNRTLPAAARWADMWDLAGPDSPATWKATSDILDQRCAAIGRNPAEIRRSVHLMWPEEADPAAMAATAADYAAAGVDLVIFSMRAPVQGRPSRAVGIGTPADVGGQSRRGPEPLLVGSHVDADDAVFDLGRIGLQVDADGRALALAGAVVEAPVVLRAFDDVVHHQAVGEQSRARGCTMPSVA